MQEVNRKMRRIGKEKRKKEKRRQPDWIRRTVFLAAFLLAVLPVGYGCTSQALIEIITSEQETENASLETQAKAIETETMPPETTEEELDFWETESQEPDHVHEYGDWTVVTDATKWQPGSKERACETCGHTEVRRIAAGHHDYDPGTGICMEDGCPDGDPEVFTEEWFAKGILTGHPESRTGEELTLPGSVGDDLVMEIGISAFENCENLKKVTILSGPEKIGMTAFSGCTGLTGMRVPNSVKAIDDAAFANCTAMTSLTFGRGVETFGYNSFSGCTSLESIAIPCLLYTSPSPRD